MLTNQSALLAIDFQVDFLDSHGRYPVAIHQIAPMLTTTNRLIAAALSYGTMVIYIGNEYSPRDLLNMFRNSAAIKGSSGVRIDPRLTHINDHYFAKDKSSAFTNSKLDVFLHEQGIKQLLLTGVYATACVRRTAMDGLKHGYQVSIVSDAIADKSDQHRDAGLKELERKGVHILTSERLLSLSFQSS
ncbi:MAG: cysteine hydrolase family protein [Aggregatilineales bacterium]